MNYICFLLFITLLIPVPVGKEPLSPSHNSPHAKRRTEYHLLETHGGQSILSRFDEKELALLEKLNRMDRWHLEYETSLIVPENWDLDELAYSSLPQQYNWATQTPKLLVVHQPQQIFGAYEWGALVRWGPVSSGRKQYTTPEGLFHLTWPSKDRWSTEDPRWHLRWYFNFHSERGLSFHTYALPGYPASHRCIRLLERDAKWLFYWGDPWKLEGDEIRSLGTPVVILGRYDFESTPPWKDPNRIGQEVLLPDDPIQGSRLLFP